MPKSSNKGRDASLRRPVGPASRPHPRSWGTSTLAIHGRARLRKAHHAVSTPIVQTSNYSFDSMAEVVEFMKAKGEGRIIREQEYGRYGNPTQQEAERKLAAIEGAERAILFSTGMSAVIMTLDGLHETGRPHYFHQRLLPADARFCHQPAHEIRHPNQPRGADRRGH